MAEGTDPRAAEQLAEQMSKVQSSAREAATSFERQLKVIMQMKDAMAEVSRSMSALCKMDCAGMSAEKWEEVSEAVEEAKDSTISFKSTAEKLSDFMKGPLAKSLIIATAAVDGLAQGFRNAKALSKGLFGLFGGIVSGAFSVAKSILSIPFKMMNGLFKMAQQGGGGNELAAAYEEVRKEFGNLSSTSAQTVIKVAKNMDKFSEKGTSGIRVFGNLAERIKYVNEFAKALGNQFQIFQDEIMENGEAILRYQRGLGLTNEQMAAIASTSQRMGTSMTKTLNDITKQSQGLGKSFGLNAKIISKEMGKAMADLAHFGSLSSKEMGVAAAYATKLGISVDKLTATMDATKTFDQTAESVSKLNEVFGTNIDSTQLMMAESPAEQMEMLRKEFQRTGQDMSKFNRFQKDLLKQTLNWDDATINAVGSMKESGDLYSKMSKEADKNEKKTLSQADAMHELASSIDRLTPSGGGAGGGVLDHIMDGITRGLQSMPQFVQLMRNLAQILREATLFGVQLGKRLFDTLPGLKQIFEGLVKLFDPVRFQRMFSGILGAFDAVFGPKGTKSLDDFMSRIGVVFEQFFKEGKAGSTDIREGFKKFGAFLISGFLALSGWVAKEVTKLIPKVAEFIPKITEFLHGVFEWLKKPKKLGVSLEGVKVPEWAKPFIDLFEAIRTILVPELKKAFEKLWPDVKPYLISGLKTFLLTAFAPALLRTVVGAATSILGGLLADGIKLAIRGIPEAGAKEAGPVATKIAEKLTGAYEGVGKFVSSSAGKIVGKVAVVAAIATAAVDVGEAINKYSDELQKEGIDPATAKIAAGTTGLVNTLTFGLLPDWLQGRLARGFADISGYIFGGIEQIAGPSLANVLKERLASAFQIFGSIGNLIKSIWKGDSAGTEQALRDLAEGLIKSFISGFLLFEVELPLAIAKLAVWIPKAIAGLAEILFDRISKIFYALEKLPIVGPLFGLFGDIFKKLSTLAGSIKDFFGAFLNFLKLIDVPKVFSAAWNAVSDFFTKSKDGANGFLSGFVDWGKKLVSIIELPYNTIRKLFNIVFSWDFNKSAVENLRDKIVGIKTAILEAWQDFKDKFKSVFIEGPKNAWNWLKENFTFDKFKELGSLILEGFMTGFSNISEKFKQPFKDAVAGIKTFLGIKSPSKVFEEIGSEIVNGMENSMSNLPVSAEKSFDKTVDAAKKMQHGMSKIAPMGPMSPAGSDVQIDPNQVETSTKIIKLITDLINALASAVGGHKIEGKIDNATVKSISAAVPGIRALLDAIKKEAGPLVEAIVTIVKAVPTDVKFKEGLDVGQKLFEFISNMTKTTSVLDIQESMPGAGAINTLLIRMKDLGSFLGGLTANWTDAGANTLAIIVSGINKMSESFPKGFAAKAETVKKTFEAITAISGAIADPFKGVHENSGIAINIMLTRFHDLSSMIGGMTANWVAGGENTVATLVSNVDKFVENASKIARQPLAMAVKNFVEVIKEIQKLDDALSKGPKVDISTKMEKLAGSLGLGSKGIYTVQSKEVVINVAFNISMDVDRVEQVLISRHNSIIRDRINFAIEKGGQQDAAASSAKIKAAGPQTGLPGQTYGT